MRSISAILISVICLCFSSDNITINKIETKTKFGNLGIYNSLNNSILYNGIDINADNQIELIGIFVKDLTSNRDVIIAKNILNPAIGWIDTNHVLIYKVMPVDNGHNTSLKYERRLISINIHTGEREIIKLPYLDSIPVPEENIIVDRGVVIYKTGYGYDKSTHYYRFELKTGMFAEYKQLRGMDITQFRYSHETNTLYFVNFIGNNRYQLSYLKDSSLRTLQTVDFEVECLDIDENNEYLYYTTRKGSRQQLMRIKLGESKNELLLYSFKEGIECQKISAYKKDALVVSLIFDSDETSNIHFEGVNLKYEAEIEVNPNMHMFIIEFNAC